MFENFKKIDEIRAIRPNISITTDIIVGFPGETESMFNETLKSAKKVNFSKIHVFPYSSRTGTKAALMIDQVSDVEKKRRVHELISLTDEQEKNYYNLFVGKELLVLIEEVYEDRSVGHTSNYLSVTIPKKLEKNNIYSFKL